MTDGLCKCSHLLLVVILIKSKVTKKQTIIPEKYGFLFRTEFKRIAQNSCFTIKNLLKEAIVINIVAKKKVMYQCYKGAFYSIFTMSIFTIPIYF